MSNHLLLYLGGTCILLCLWMGCQSVSSSSQQSPVVLNQRIGRTDLIQRFKENPVMNLVYEANGGKSEEIRQHLEDLADRARWFNLKVVADTALQDSVWQSESIYLIGDHQSHEQLSQWKESLPFQTSALGFTYENQVYQSEDHTLLMTFLPHPTHDQQVLSIMTGNSSEAIWEKLAKANPSSWSHPLFSQWGYEIAQGDVRLQLGQFTDDWQVDPQQHWNLADGDAAAAQSSHFNLIPHDKKWDIQVLEDFSLNLEQNYQHVANFLGSDPQLDPIKYHLYANAESIGLRTRRMKQAFVKGEAVHEILHPVFLGKHTEALQSLILEQALGKPKNKRLQEGLAVVMTPRWQGKGHRHWAQGLYHADAVLNPADLVDEDLMKNSSYLICNVWSAMWVDFLIERMGKEAFLDVYLTLDPSSSTLRKQEDAWREWLAKQFPSRPVLESKKKKLSYMGGMTLAHEGYNIIDGYGSYNAQKAVKELEDIGVNALAIVPYSGSRAIRTPEPYSVWQGAGSENDVSVIFAKHYGWEHRMRSLLKPQIYFPGAWPGAVDMQNEADWNQFFIYYRRWIMHYALLAAIHDFDHFCIGVEFTNATLKHPEQWRKMANDVRHIYAGYVTYAANWGEEAEKIAFADALDYVGVNCYYPLSDKDNPTDAELDAGVQRIMEKMTELAARIEKPLVFTEVGFRSVKACWKNPHEEPNGAPASEEDQARCYQAMFKGLEGQSWFKGMYWWKWPTYMSYAREQPKSFTPAHKKAQEYIKQALER
ncbi:MAG: hypothetical protein AAFP83_04285 [Bacteroidota bacterium]